MAIPFNLKRFLRASVWLAVICFLASQPFEARSEEAEEFHAYDDAVIVGIDGYEVFQEPMAGFSTEVPKNWKSIGEMELTGLYSNGGKAYRWRGPESSIGVGNASLAIFVVPVTAGGTSMGTLEQYSELLKKKRLSYHGEILADQPLTLGGQGAFETTVRYPSLAASRAYGSASSNRKEIWTVARRGDYYVQVVYSAEESDYDNYLSVYTHAKETLK